LELDWRDIGSAPKDGRPLFLRENGRVFQGSFSNPDAGSLYNVHHWINTLALKREPTHWMPLPATSPDPRTALIEKLLGAIEKAPHDAYLPCGMYSMTLYPAKPGEKPPCICWKSQTLNSIRGES
jgi:hypothetical protein